MAITFGKKNQRIRANSRKYFLGSYLEGLNSYTDFHLMDNNNGNYVTGIFLMSNSRYNLSNYSNSNNNWYGNGYLWNHGWCLHYWEYANSSSVWPYYTNNRLNSSTSYVHLRENSVWFTPTFFNRKGTYRSGSATWFVLQTRYSSTQYGMLTGSVGAVGSGADMEIQIVDGNGNPNRSDTYMSGTSYMPIVPRGLEIHAPPPPLTV